MPSMHWENTLFCSTRNMYETNYDKQQLAAFYDVQPQAIVWMRPVMNGDKKTIVDFEYSYANPEGLRFLTLSPEQFNGLRISVSPTLNDAMREQFIQDLTKVYETGQQSEETVYNPVLNKYARLLRTRMGNGVLNIVQDITKESAIIRQLEAQKQQLETQKIQLEEQKTLLDNILRNSSNGISVSQIFRDGTGKVVDALTIMANDSAVKYIGFPKEIYLTKKATEIEPGVLDSPYYQACIKTLETGEPFMMQYYVEATGRWLELTVSKLDDDHLIQIFTDVTPIKEIHIELQKAAETLKTVFDSAQTGMFTFSPVHDDSGAITDFRFVMVNAAVSEYVGGKPEELEGALGSEWFPSFKTSNAFDMYRSCFETGVPQRREIHYHDDGRELYYDIRTVKSGELLVVSLNDYTSLRTSQQELQQTIRALERSNTHLEDFAHAASHDLKEPLRKIMTFADRLKSTLLAKMTETESGLFERIETAAKRMQILVDDLLNFSHVSEQTQNIEQIDLNEKVQRVISDLELPIDEKSASIITGELPVVKGNRRQIQQLFQNLIGNALKYSKPDVPPVIKIQSRTIKADALPVSFEGSTAEAYHLIEVSDNGIGFEQEYAEKIFAMFQRLHGKSEYSGTGVGLAIVRKVVENHNGHIWAEGKPEVGACFRVLLPV